MEFSTLSKRYHGDRADQYDRDREQTAKWELEQSAVASLLSSLPRPFSLVDIPVGTGRFVELYKQLGLDATGIDVSSDMLAKARAKAELAGAGITLKEGDVRAISAPDGTFHVALCVRFLNWIDITGVRAVLRELARVSDRYVLVSISYFVPFREAELTSAKGLRALAGQLARRFKTQVTRSARKRRIIFHEERDVKAAIADAGLRIAEGICTEPGARGVRSYIYLLEKEPRSRTNR
jgi:ubiquinone/menaquinone biosynthesis C-methylase UbiE